MFDPFLLLTPILVLAVLALVRFIGCDIILGLERDPPSTPGELRVVYGNERITLIWGASSNAGKYQIRQRDMPSDPFIDGPVVSAPQTRSDSIFLPYNVTRYYQVVAVAGELESGPSNDVVATGARPLVTQVDFGTPGTTFDGWMGMVIEVQSTALTVVALGRVANNNFTHEVKIVDASGMIVEGAQTAVEPTSEITAGHFRYENLEESAQLTANTTYFVLTHEAQNTDQCYEYDTEVSTQSEAAVSGGVYQEEATPGIYTRQGVMKQSYGPVDILYHPRRPGE
jgi:hypothetical protein